MAIPEGMLADPAELAALLGVPADDPKMLAALRAASRRFRGATRPTAYTPVTGDDTMLDGDGSTALLLPSVPVTAVSVVEVLGDPLDPSTDVDWSEAGVLRRRVGCWPDRLRGVRVVYDHGFAEVPEDVQEVVIDQARIGYEIRPGVQSISVDGQSVTYGAAASVGATQAWTDTVARYRLRSDRA